jgi:hypothetical protein
MVAIMGFAWDGPVRVNILLEVDETRAMYAPR